MPAHVSFIPNLITTGSGLGGVWLGAWLTSRREQSRESARSEKDATYLAILVVTHLDRFVNGCVSVVSDDGTAHGAPAGSDGSYAPTVETPTFDPLSLAVEWKALPPGLMYGILGLPYKIEVLNRRISTAAEGDDDYPYYGDLF